MDQDTPKPQEVTVGLDLGDRYSHYCLLDAAGKVVEEGKVETTPEAFRRRFAGTQRVRIAIEAGTHSPWVSRLLGECGQEVLVANPRKLRGIYQNDSKNDRVDAQWLARVARMDPKLLAPIHHRGEAVRKDLTLLRSREVLV
jgi:transposase